MKIKHPLQTSLICLLIFGFYACEKNTTKEEIQLNDIELNLKSTLSFGHFFPQRELAFSETDEAIQVKNIPAEFSDYELKNFTFNIAKAYYQDFKNQKIAAEEFQMLQQIYNIDTTQLSPNSNASKLYLIIGELNNGNRAVVVDTDLDLDFADEKLQEFEYPILFIDEEDEAFYERNKIKLLPKAEVRYGKNEADLFTMFIDPYEGDLATNSYSEKYFLSLSIPLLKTQQLQIKDKSFVIEAKSNFTQVENNPEKLHFLVFEKRDSVDVDKQINLLHFEIGDTINLNQNDFSLSYEDEKYILKSLGFNDKPTGVTEGFFLPEIQTNYINGESYSAEEYKGKFQLFYFWTTWSLPSLEDLVKLKEVEEIQLDLAIVGVAVDANQGAVERMILRQEMDWKTLYAPPETLNKIKPAIQFNVMSFPTYILVDADQKIVKRTHHLKEVVSYLDEVKAIQ